MSRVKIVDQGCYERTFQETRFMEVEVPELRQYTNSAELWDTGQKAVMDEHAGFEFMDLSAYRRCNGQG